MYLAKKAYKDLCYSTISIETGMSGIATLQKAYESGNYDPEIPRLALRSQTRRQIHAWKTRDEKSMKSSELCIFFQAVGTQENLVLTCRKDYQPTKKHLIAIT
ncbi:hypothetical protein NC652_019930 [Populus alba x Populus x berolinensis]|nr:hypothetical protein NC652_019930 [Populus alba x Populus x berolinensis]